MSELCFEQIKGGGVRVFRRNADGTVTVLDEIEKNRWHSTIAQMSYYGEGDYGFYRAANFHSGEPVHATCPLIEKPRLW